MSKSTAKYITVGWAYGSNTEYYRERAKIKRAKNKMRLRVALKDGKDFIAYIEPKRRPNFEPTDGVKMLKANDKYLKYYKGIYTTCDGKIKK